MPDFTVTAHDAGGQSATAAGTIVTTGGGALNLPLLPWEGGPTYYAQFPKANAAGWSSPNFFPIGIFLGPTQAPHPQNALAAGCNFYQAIESNPPLSLVTNAGMHAWPQMFEWTQAQVGNDAKAISWFIGDEIEMDASFGDENGRLAEVKRRVDIAKGYGDGRFTSFNIGNGVLRTFWCPNTVDDMVQYCDTTSCDHYSYTSPQARSNEQQSGDWPGGTPGTSGVYGWCASQMRSFQNPSNRKPFMVIVETARPLLNETGAGTITVPQIEGAMWAAIRHEARGIIFFQQNNNTAQPFYSVTDAGSSIRAGIAATCSKIRNLAPVLNTQTYVWDFANGTDTMLKAKDGIAYLFAGIGLTQITGTKIFSVPFAAASSVTVVGENRMIPISNSSFSDSFPNEYTEHVYQFAFNPAWVPPPPPPGPFGETAILPTPDNGNGNLLLAQNATLSTAGTLQSLSFYITTPGGQLRLGIYDATGPSGGPGALKAQTNAFTPVVGWNTQPVTTPVVLPTGTYWLAYHPQSNTLAFVKGTTAGVTNRFYPKTFGILSAAFSTTPSSDLSHWSLYATMS